MLTVPQHRDPGKPLSLANAKIILEVEVTQASPQNHMAIVTIQVMTWLKVPPSACSKMYVNGFDAAAVFPRSLIDRSKLPWRVDATQAGGGFVMDLGCHTLDILDFICGPLLHPTGRAANLAGVYEVEDTVGLTFKLENGAFGTAIWNFAAGFREDTIEIIGTNGKISLSTFSDEPIAVTHDNEVSYLEIRNPIHIQQPLIQTIVNELHGDGKCPSTGQSACRTAKILDVALSEYYGGREDAFWSRPISWPGRPSRL